MVNKLQQDSDRKTRQDSGTPDGKEKKENGASVPDDATYQCPYCGHDYTHEILTRAHITRAGDQAHVNRDGFSPDISINVISESQGLVHTVTRSTVTELDPTSLTITDLPNTLSQRHKHVVLAGAHYPTEDTYTELEDITNRILREQGCEELSYSSVRRVIREFYHPGSDNTGTPPSVPSDQKEEDNELGGLTDTQQAIIITRLAHPEDPKTKIAERANGASISYPTQVLNNNEDVVEKLKEQVEAGTPIEKVIATALPANDVDNLESAGYFTDVGIDVSRLRLHLPTNEENTEAAASSQANATLVTPGEPDASADTLRKPSTAQRTLNNPDDPETISSQPQESVPVSDVEEIREKAEMYAEVLSPGDQIKTDPEAYMNALKDLTEELEQLTERNN